MQHELNIYYGTIVKGSVVDELRGSSKQQSPSSHPLVYGS